MPTIFNPANRLADGIVIGGNAFFNRSTKPTTRIGGSALQIGDRWRKNDDGTEWVWNGTYWLSSQLKTAYTMFFGTISASRTFTATPLDNEQSLTAGSYFIESVAIAAGNTAGDNSSNFWTLSLNLVSFAGAYSPAIYSEDTSDGKTTFTNKRLDLAFTYPNVTTVAIGWRMDKTGNPANRNFLCVDLTYRAIYP